MLGTSFCVKIISLFDLCTYTQQCDLHCWRSLLQHGFGDRQVVGPLPPVVATATVVNSRKLKQSAVDLTFIPYPTGTPVPLSICGNRVVPHHFIYLTIALSHFVRC